MAKRCTKCNRVKPLSEFHKRARGGDGRNPRCRKCVNAVTRQRRSVWVRGLEAAAKERKATRNRARLRNTGVTPQEYDQMFKEQEGLCAICSCSSQNPLSGRWCEGTAREISLDHDHNTDKGRGLLCSRCNSALGLVHDNTTILKNMISYLERHSPQPA